MPAFIYKPKPQSVVVDGANPLTNQLVLDIPMFEGVGTTVRNLFSPVSNGTLTGAGVTWTTTLFGPGLSFGTGTELVSVPMSGNFNNLTRMSFEFMAYAADSSVSRRYFDNGMIAAQASGIAAGVGNVACNLVASTTNPASTTNGTLWSATALNHTVITYDDIGDRKVHIYINGIEATYATQTAAVGTLTTLTGTFDLGNRAAGDRTLNGKMLYFRAWSRPLLAREVMNLAINPWQIYRQPKKYN